eukprot:TRINITY_DN11706_c0_g1_i1.p2 TRINITY_DN11706_c0_g1~~TRINITY_DN11706_c0_g1_i1.p2  ORF type:complete len:190 (+),score=3.13 TRINITY_DN11706_c0_g1_i1:367-936(+)
MAEAVAFAGCTAVRAPTTCSLAAPAQTSLKGSFAAPLRSWAAGCSARSAARQQRSAVVAPRNVAMSDSLSGLGEEGGERPEYPAGMYRYESMVVLRPDLTEEERVSLTERYEESLVAGGALDVEIYNRGMQPLAYSIKTKNMGGVMSRYLDGIFFIFMYVSKPEAQVALQQRLNTDDDVIRSTTFRLKA